MTRSVYDMRAGKTCSKCGVRKPLSEFYRSSKGQDGRRADCKTCHRRYVNLRAQPGWRGPSGRLHLPVGVEIDW